MKFIDKFFKDSDKKKSIACAQSKKALTDQETQLLENALKEIKYDDKNNDEKLIRDKNICVLFDNICVPFLAPLVSGMQQGINAFKANERFNLLYFASDGILEKKLTGIRSLTKNIIDGVIMFGSASENQAVFEYLEKSNVPYLLIEHDQDRVNADKILIDNFDGSREIVDYLLKKGKRRIAHIAWDPTIYISKERFCGYKKALQDFGVEVDFDLVVFPSVEDFKIEDDEFGGQVHFDAGFKATENLIKRGIDFDAIFYGGDLMAFGGQFALEQHGIRVPEDVALVGFDNELPQTYAMPGRAITTMEQPLREAGYLAVRTMINRIENPDAPHQRLMIKAKLIERDTV